MLISQTLICSSRPTKSLSTMTLKTAAGVLAGLKMNSPDLSEHVEDIVEHPGNRTKCLLHEDDDREYTRRFYERRG